MGWLVWAVGLMLASAVALAQAPSAADMARLTTDVRRIEAAFVDQVAGIAGVPAARIRQLLPSEPRIAERGPWLAQAISKEIRPLSESEVRAVLAADRERKNALAASRRR